MRPSNRNARAGDNAGDMRAPWSAEDTEAVLRGRRPQSTDAARLGPAIAALRSRGHGTADPSAVAAMASLLADAARASGGRPLANPIAARGSVSPWRRRVSVVGVVGIVATAGLWGTAAAANGAAPGDALYGTDRALEVIGIDNGGSRERLVEADKLASEGKIDGALRHAAEALQGTGDASSQALLSAADRIAATGSGNSAEVKAQVSRMLGWMTTASAQGKDFGQTVNSYARDLGGSDGNATDSGGSSSQNGQGNSSDPGRSSNPGTSSSPGSSGKPGNSGDQGNASDPGKSRDPGKSNAPNTNVVAPSGASESHPGNKSRG